MPKRVGFFGLINKNNTNGCWIWIGSKTRGGYGRYSHNGYAHRWAYENYKGPIPEDLEIDHLCFNPSCVNPDHLEVVTHHENVLRTHRRRHDALEKRLLETLEVYGFDLMIPARLDRGLPTHQYTAQSQTNPQDICPIGTRYLIEALVRQDKRLPEHHALTSHIDTMLKRRKKI